ncbi:phage terminase large subunit [Listeria booriae]|uniref:Phage terminase large subunit n=1 Tax=Listeria booriae TaxID=1552123 RepID=A0A841ZR08_9LIST|nr:phage terminase large subunit [Listeria booriae]MBC1564168.1 phage terminase large subunit [Listeria booriae]
MTLEWLDRDARQTRIDLLKKRAKLLQQLHSKGRATRSQQDTLLADLRELEQLTRVHRAEHDVLFFMYEYFSEDRNPANLGNLIPAGQTLETAAEFHRELCGMLDDITRGNVKSHVGWAVGRNHAKTAYLSNAFLCQQVVYRLRKYIVEVSETTDVAGDFINWTKLQLKFNAKLREDFGELLYEQNSRNELDNKYEFITLSGTKVEAKGTGTQMRGLRYLNTRPDLFLLDDLESNQNTNTKELREKNLHWFQSEMLQALDAGGLCVYMGTIVHYDSLLNHVITKSRQFKSKKFPAITSFSESPNLWAKWREIYNNDDEQAKDQADAFYGQNKAEMLKGTSTLWASRYDYKYFMEKREEMGSKAFNQEYMNNPLDEESRVFDPDKFTYYVESDVKLSQCDIFAAVDFAMGKQKGDYSALITIARKRDTGICYIIDTVVERLKPDAFLKLIVEKTMHFQYEMIAVEAQAAQEWFADKLGDALKERGYPATTRLKKVKQKTRKELRIEAMLPDIESGRVRFHKSHRMLLEQLEYYPNHNHDDAPDALADALKLATTAKAVEVIKRRAYR